jgi:hypothetical protein
MSLSVLYLGCKNWWDTSIYWYNLISQWKSWGKANINLRIDNNFCYYLKYLCSPKKGCFSCVALKRAVFCKRCYCCLMPVIFAWNSGCWSFSAKYLSDLCRDLSGKTCFNLSNNFVVVNSQINVSFSPALIWLSLSLLNLKYYLTYQKKNVWINHFVHSRQLPWSSVFCCYLLLYRLGKSISFSQFKFKNLHIKQHWSFVFLR